MINGKSFSIVLYVMCDLKKNKKQKHYINLFLSRKPFTTHLK